MELLQANSSANCQHSTFDNPYEPHNISCGKTLRQCVQIKPENMKLQA